MMALYAVVVTTSGDFYILLDVLLINLKER